jgi:hypothetical protein
MSGRMESVSWNPSGFRHIFNLSVSTMPDPFLQLPATGIVGRVLVQL